MTSYDKLIRHFERFPGIGSRQAKRFLYHLLTEDHSDLVEFADLISSVKNAVTKCHACMRFYVNGHNAQLCPICSDTAREEGRLMVVERDADIEPIERAGIYKGRYFVLGGSVPLLESEEIKKLNGGALKEILKQKTATGTVEEIILAFAVNPDGENTARYLQKLIKDTLGENHSVTVTTLGRGLSTGSELEYADPETIKNAFRNRAAS